MRMGMTTMAMGSGGGVGKLPPEITAVNATKTTSGAWQIYSFPTSGTFQSTQDVDVEFLIVGGGAAGGNRFGGGGGAGGVLTNVGGTKITLRANETYTVTVGAGGLRFSCDINAGGNGGKSSLVGGPHNLYCYGGGSAGVYTTNANGKRRADQSAESPYLVGSGGGATAGSGSGGLSDKGSAGAVGNAGGASGAVAGGGGGGAGGVGILDPGTGINAGAGIQNSITGSALWYAAGGQGCGANVRTPYSQNDIGGKCSTAAAISVDAVAGTGSGGGSGYTGTNYQDGSAGGSGVVIIRFEA